MVFFLKESVFTPVKKFKLKLLIIRTQVVKKAEGAFLNRAVGNYPLKTNNGNNKKPLYRPKAIITDIRVISLTLLCCHHR